MKDFVEMLKLFPGVFCFALLLLVALLGLTGQRIQVPYVLDGQYHVFELVISANDPIYHKEAK